MRFNACLAGLVGVTAGCNNVDALGAAIIGIVSGILVVVVVEGLDLKLHIDDPVGAVGVHCANGIWARSPQVSFPPTPLRRALTVLSTPSFTAVTSAPASKSSAFSSSVSSL